MSSYNLKYTSNFIKHFKAKRKTLISQGSGRSGKTYSILQLLILRAFSEKNKVISVVGENMPFLKRGAFTDFKRIMQDSGLWDVGKFNKTDHIYTFPTGTIIQFFSVENPGLALGAARDYLFINECNNIKYETAFQLIARTKGKIFLDFNPVSEFWVHKEIMENSEFNGQWDFVKTTFAGNEELDESIKQSMLARAAKDPNYKRVYVDGEVGITEGAVFNNYNLIDEIPDEVKLRAKKQYFGLDFGWSPDPTSINEIYILGSIEKPVEEIYIRQVTHKNKLSNKQIGEIIAREISDNYLVIADYAEPKSISEIQSYGINIIGATSKDINYGLGLINNANVYITKDSIETINEFRNYKYATNRYGEPLKDAQNRPIPIDNWNHCFTYDTLITTIYGEKMIGELRRGDMVLTTKGYKRVNKQGSSGIKKINEYNLTFDTIGYDSCRIRCTDKHLFKINNKWKEINKIKPQDKIILNNTLTADGTTFTQVKDIIQKVENIYTEKYGSSIMERFQKVITFITLMGILIIMKSITYKLLKVVNIWENIVGSGIKKIKRRVINTLKKFNISLKNGIKQKRVRGLNQKIVENIGILNLILEKQFATVVVQHLRRKGVVIKKDSAQTNVSQNGEEIQGLTMLRGNVPVVVKYLPQTNILKLNIVRDVEVKEVEVNNIADEYVYDIEVEDAHEFFANNVLVHNSIDNIRYAALYVDGLKYQFKKQPIRRNSNLKPI